MLKIPDINMVNRSTAGQKTTVPVKHIQFVKTAATELMKKEQLLQK